MLLRSVHWRATGNRDRLRNCRQNQIFNRFYTTVAHDRDIFFQKFCDATFSRSFLTLPVTVAKATTLNFG